ncbi:ABC transporter ATP-binding protein [Microvirga pudoricolor]|uniref:ABC transporter ATP-binding protein n=1 Tax=Microvirga pudoricolor TaxID=2778729 RepID=UPI0019516A5D|nr:ABC transporter ATP-binding protein [Microvirga pudoricolor]MBM6596368.1 ABC transporter ATP-binding protein [Microvirga pudoricolor]
MAKTLLSIEDLEVTFRVPDATGQSRRLVKAVRGVSLHVARGEVLGIVGESGSGKSTVARTIVGLNQRTAGTIKVAGRELTVTRGSAARAGVQMVFQDHASTLNPFQTVGRILDDVMRVAQPGRSAAERRATAQQLMSRIGLDVSALERRPSSFSGGQRQRISIARALTAEPRLLLCDEPTSALDVSVQAQILALLETLKRDGLTMVFISHNLAVVRQVADRIAVMYAGLIVEQGPAAELIEAPTHPYTRALVDAAPLLTKRGSLLAQSKDLRMTRDISVAVHGCPFANRCPRADTACSALPPLAEVKRDWSSRCHHPVLDDGGNDSRELLAVVGARGRS